MRPATLAIPLLLLSGWAYAQQSSCAGAAPQPIRPNLIAPAAPELGAPSQQLGAPTGVLAQAFDEAQSIDNVLFRMRLEGCQSAAASTSTSSKAKAAAPAAPAAPAAAGTKGNVVDPASYKPKTQHDNTPYRFNMTQSGKRMTADDFDAWLKATGYSAGRRVQTDKEAAEGAQKAAEDAPKK